MMNVIKIKGEMIVCCVGGNTLLDRVQKTNPSSIYKNPLGEKMRLVQEKIGSSSINSSSLIILLIIIQYFLGAHYAHSLFTL